MVNTALTSEMLEQLIKEVMDGPKLKTLHMNRQTLRAVTEYDGKAFVEPRTGLKFFESPHLGDGEVLIVDDIRSGRIYDRPPPFSLKDMPEPRPVWSAYERKLRQIIALGWKYTPLYGDRRVTPFGIWLLETAANFGIISVHLDTYLTRGQMLKKTLLRLTGINKNWWPKLDL